MNEANFIADIRQHWIENGADLTTGGAAPIAVQQWWEDDEGEPSPPAPYTRCIIRAVGGAAVTIGRTREETRGLITVQVFAPHEGGPGASERIAATVAQKWRSFRHSRVKLGAPNVAGLTRQGAFNRQLVTVGWRADLRPALA